MTRKHFRALADALKTNQPSANSGNCQRDAELFKNIVVAIGTACRSFNSRFNADRFHRACGLDSIRER